MKKTDKEILNKINQLHSEIQNLLSASRDSNMDDVFKAQLLMAKAEALSWALYGMNEKSMGGK